MVKFYLLFRCILVAFLCSGSFAVLAQTKTVTGKVTSSDDGIALPGVNILEKGTSNGTVTDSEGKFTIVVSGNTTLSFSFVGFVTQEIVVGAQTAIDVSLQADVATLSEVVVIGYGEVQQKDLTGAVTAIGTKDFNRGVLTSPQDLITGRIAGVAVTSGDGAPGSKATIRIRGGASLKGNNDPLIVIDGVPVDATDPGGLANPLSAINPNDIETFTVLKDASATAIYGSRASNGVIIITTKKGKQGKPQLSYNGNVSVSTPVRYLDVMDGDEFRALVNELQEKGIGGINDAAKQKLGSENTNWQKEIFRTAVSHDHNISLGGAVKNFPYRISYGYTDQQGILKTTGLKRNSLNVNLTPTFLDGDLKVTISAKGSHIVSDFGDAGAVGNAVGFDPTQPVRDGNEEYGGYFSWLGKGIVNGNSNPVAMLEQTDNQGTSKRLIGNAQVEYRLPFFKDLKATLNLGMDNMSSDGHNIAPLNAGFIHAGLDLLGRNNTYGGKNESKLLDFYLTYNKIVGNHKIDATLGYGWQHFYRETYSLNQDAVNQPVATNPKSENFLVSFFGRVNYTFKDRYTLTATVREDGTSRTKDHWGFFPALSAAWRIKDENFLTGVDFISDLKLRAGYGVTGQQDLPNAYYPYLAVYKQSDIKSQYQLGPAFYYTLRPQPYDANFKWEETTTYNVGLDFGILNDRLRGSIDLFQKESVDLLNNIPIPNGVNFSNFLDTNVGTMINKGVEVSLNATPVSTGDFSWDLGINLTSISSEITKLNLTNDPSYPGIPEGNVGVGAFIQNQQVGHPAFSYLVFQQVYDQAGKPIEGLYVDRSGTGGSVIANSNNKYYYNRPVADVLMGFNSRVKYKKLDFAFSSRLSLGNYVYNNVEAGNAYYNNVYTLEHFRNVPSYVRDTDFISQQTYSDYYVQNASFFKLDNVNVGYSFDKLFTEKLKARVGVTVQNVFTITDYKGIDPEINGGLDNNLYPRPRTFLLGVNVTF